MIETTPVVWLIARPTLDERAILDYLRAVGGEEWWHRQMEHGATDAERLVEFAGRLCYRSWKPGLNKNVRKIREDSAEYFANLLASAHGSVLEHANYTFVFHNVSRVFTHELVRHRVGVAISQESLRYVRLTELSFRVPKALESIRQEVVQMVEQLEEFQLTAAQLLDLDTEGLPFAEKKVITSALRRLAPLGLSTSILWTANVRTIRHVLAARTALGAEEEMRLVFDRVGHYMRQEAPLLFQDFRFDGPGSPPAWVPEHPVAGSVRV